jgi:hypothetical protein
MQQQQLELEQEQEQRDAYAVYYQQLQVSRLARQQVQQAATQAERHEEKKACFVALVQEEEEQGQVQDVRDYATYYQQLNSSMLLPKVFVFGVTR